MSTEEHLIENCLYTYRNARKRGAENGFEDIFNNDIILKQCKECNVDVNTMVEFVDYIYWSLLDNEEIRDKVFVDY